MRILRWATAALVLLTAAGLSLAAPALGQPAEQAPTGWLFELTPYIWMTGVTGDIRAGEAGGSIGASFSQVLDSLDLALMGKFEARKGRLGFLFDGFYAKLSKDGVTSGVAEMGVHASLKTQLYAFALSFRALKGRVPLDIIGGVRVMPVSAALELTSGALTGQQASGSNTAVDGFVGARLALPLASRWALDAYADIGTGDSKLTWQALGGLGLRLSHTLSAKLGYRYFSVENEASGFQTKIAEGGFYIGLGIRL